jgi:hypothetical protein
MKYFLWFANILNLLQTFSLKQNVGSVPEFLKKLVKYSVLVYATVDYSLCLLTIGLDGKFQILYLHMQMQCNVIYNTMEA